MNSARELLKRLLNLYPIKSIKEHFNLTGNAIDVIEVISAKPINDIKSFAFSHHDHTKQNIHLFELGRTFVKANMPNGFPFSIEKDNVVNGEYIFLILPKTTYSVYLSNPMAKPDIIFYQPVIIRIKQKSLVIQFTKLKKDVNSYFPEARDAKKAAEVNTEDDTLKAILEYFTDNYNSVEVNDFNKGLKHIWAGDQIDCHKIHRTNAHSVALETMNGTLTFKEQYPEDYKRIITKPIGISIWKYMLADSYFCEGFTLNPTEGFIGITSSPKLSNQVNNVLTKILEHN
jgi:hypothetical protein